MMDYIEASFSLIFRVYHIPRGLLDVRVREHFILGARVLDPPPPGLQVHRAQLPALGDVPHALLESAFLFFIAYRKPILHQDDAGSNQHPLEFGTAVQELEVLAITAKS